MSRGDDGVGALLVLAGLAFVGFCYWLSRQIGADLGPTIESVMWSIASCVLAFAMCRWLMNGEPICTYISVFLALLWPAWTPVLNNLAEKSVADFVADSAPWQSYLGDWWLKLLVEAVIVAVGVWCYRRNNY